MSDRSDEQPEAAHSAVSPSSGAASRPRSLWRSTLFAIKAIEIRLRFVAVLVAVGLTIGYWDTIRNWWDKWTRPSTGDVAAVSSDEEFYCPMHPSVVRDQPDPGGAIPKCPICGMPLALHKKGEVVPLPEGVVSRVQLSPYRVELAGVRTVVATREPLVRELRTVGYVAVD